MVTHSFRIARKKIDANKHTLYVFTHRCGYLQPANRVYHRRQVSNVASFRRSEVTALSKRIINVEGLKLSPSVAVATERAVPIVAEIFPAN